MVEFLDSRAFLLLLISPLLAWFFYSWEKTRAIRLKLLGGAHRSGQLGLWVKTGVALILLFVLARPYSGFEDLEIRSKSGSTLIVLDISLSMLARDLPPNRLQFARFKIKDLLEQFQKDRPGEKVGLILFAGESYLYCPLTADYGAFKLFLDSISPDLISTPGSLLNRAIERGIKAFDSSIADKKEILLISDGEDDLLDASSSIQLAKEAKIPISVLGLGSEEGSPIELERGQFVKNRKGEIVISKLNDQLLKQIASDSGGTYSTASLDGSDLTKLFPRANLPELNIPGVEKERLEGSAGKTSIRIYHEVGPFLLQLLILVLLILLLSRRKDLVFSFLLLSLCLSRAEAQQASELAFEGKRLYESGDYSAAAEHFSKARELDRDNLDLLEGLASALYKQEKYDEALKLFSELESSTKSARSKFEANYDIGNTYFQKKDFKNAIKHYEKSLQIKPNDQSAENNLSLAKEMLKQQEEQKQKEEEKKQDKSEDKEQEKEAKEEQDKESSDSGENTENKESQKDQESNPKDQNDSEESNQNEEQNSSQENESEKQKPDSGESEENASEDTSPDPKTLSQKEANAWLDSLPDNPALLQSKRKRVTTGTQQTW